MRRSTARHPIYYQAPAPRPRPRPAYDPPEPRGGGAGAIISAISTAVLVLSAVITAAVFVWKVTGGVIPSLPGSVATVPTVAAITGQAGVTVKVPSAPAADAPPAAIQAAAPPALVAPPIEAAPAGVDTLGRPIPTAIVHIPTAIPIEQVRVIPQSMPVLAPDPLLPTAIPTMAIPTPLPAGGASAFDLSPDGKCITARRDGKRYQVCQEWKYAPVEMATVADFIRGGVLPGVEVPH